MGQPDRMLSIEGTSAAVAAAQHEIDQLLEESRSRMPQQQEQRRPASETARIPVPATKVGLVIGKGRECSHHCYFLCYRCYHTPVGGFVEGKRKFYLGCKGWCWATIDRPFCETCLQVVKQSSKSSRRRVLMYSSIATLRLDLRKFL